MTKTYYAITAACLFVIVVSAASLEEGGGGCNVFFAAHLIVYPFLWAWFTYLEFRD